MRSSWIRSSAFSLRTPKSSSSTDLESFPKESQITIEQVFFPIPRLENQLLDFTNIWVLLSTYTES